MKKPLLLVTLLGLLVFPALSQAQTPSAAESTQSETMEALGASASTGIFYAHMALNSLGDGWSTKVYTDDTAVTLCGGYKGGIDAMSKALADLVIPQSTILEGDQDAIKILMDCCTLVSAQSDALSAHIQDPTPDNAKIYAGKRLEAQKMIFKFMGLESASLPVIGNAIETK